MHCALYLGAVAVLAGFAVGYLVARAPGARAGRRILAAAHARASSVDRATSILAAEVGAAMRELAAVRGVIRARLSGSRRSS